MDCPSELIEQSILLGSSTKFVQGAGGNLSAKSKDVLWIKASGKRLKDASAEYIYLPMSLEETKTEVLIVENLQHCCIDNPATMGLRPSIETAIHSLLPHKYIAHVHSLGAISRAISKNASQHLDELEVDATKAFIPYVKPGIPLANAILEKLEQSKLLNLQNLIILLGNHGVIVASENISEVTQLIIQIENIWNPGPILPELEIEYSDIWSMLFLPGTLNSNQSKFLTQGPLTPDQIVFLGSKPFTDWNNQTPESKVSVMSDGSVWVNSSLSNDAIEIVSSFVRIAKLLPFEEELVYLSEADVYELLNWDAEKWRKIQEK